MNFLSAKNLVTQETIAVSTHDSDGNPIGLTHKPTQEEIELVEEVFGDDEYQFLIIEA